MPVFVARYPGGREAAWLQLEWAIAAEEGGDFAAARPLLDNVIATPTAVLAEDDPLREVATLQLAVVRRQLGDAAGAQSVLAASGLDSERCSLVDTRPIPTNLSIVSSQFPMEALRWSFEEFVKVSYDIGANGHVANVRTVVAYPPFVFGPGTERAAANFRYAAPTINGNPVGCSGEVQTVTYQVPR